MPGISDQLAFTQSGLSNFNTFIWIPLSALVFSAFSTQLLLGYLRRKNIMDVANERSSHSGSVPRGGGIAFKSVSIMMLMLITWLTSPTGVNLYLLSLAAITIGFIGFIDDIKSLNPLLRLVAQLIASVLVIIAGIDFANITLGITLSPILSMIFAILFLIWNTNLFNFMDGIDGIAGSQIVTVGLSSFFLISLNGPHSLGLVWLTIAASAIGFLIWNWHPAKLFMGDVGSASAGFILAALALWGESSGIMKLPIFLILHGYFIVDATYTLIVRVSRGKKPHIAHRSHAYQHAVQSGWTHSKTTSAMILINLIWLLPIAWYAIDKSPALQMLMICIAYAPLLVVNIFMKAGFDWDESE